MKFALFTAFCLTATVYADTPASIIADYRVKAKQATERLDSTLMTEASKIAADLVQKGYAEGAKAVTTQVEEHLAGTSTGPATAPLNLLLQKYDAARAAAMAPIQKASLARIDSLLKTAGGQKIDVVTELAKARVEVESGRVAPPIPSRWSYHNNVDAKPIAAMELHPNGTWSLLINATGKIEKGTWKTTDKPNVITLNYAGSSWDMMIEGRKASMNRPDSGMRYLKAFGNATL